MKRVLLLFILLLTVGVPAFSQTTHSVTGKILDEHNQGLAGAGVSVKGLQIGTVADVNGDFMLDVPDGDNIFVIQATGYNTREVTEGDGTITVKMLPVARQLEGTASTAQDIKREKRELGYCTTTLSGEELNSAGNTSILSSLAGKAAGINVTSSTGGPGGATRIVSRGEKSILNNNNMLVVVDGIVTNNYDRTQSKLSAASSSFSQLSQVDFGNSANDLNPEEVESVTVLPAAVATALYGTKGANGAIMITTKQGRHNTSGKRSKMNITYKASYTQSDVLKYADLQHEYGQGDLYNAANANTQTYSWGPKFDNYIKPWGQMIGGKQMVKQYSDQQDNIKSFFNHGKDLNNYVSVSGGGETSTYFLSVDALNSSGVVPNTFYNRYSVRFNGTTQLSNNFYSSINVNYLNTYSRAETGGNAPGSIMNQLNNTPRDIPVWELKDYTNHFYSMQYYDAGGTERYGAYSLNPFWTANFFDNRNKTDRILGDVKLGYKKGAFNVYDRVGADVNSDRSFYMTPDFNAQPVDPTYSSVNFVSPGGFTQYNYNGFRMTNDLVVDFAKPLSENFGINALVGHNATIEHDESLAGIIDPATNGLVVPKFYNLQNNSGPVLGFDNKTDRRTFGLYSDVTLNFQRELFLELSGRNDWASTILQDRQSYFYPGANASWVFTERLKGTGFREKAMNYGKIRVGGSAVGSDPLSYMNNNAGYGQMPINTTYGSVTTPFNGIPAYQVQNAFGDKNLKPEQTRMFEAGTDLSFLRDRISTSFTYYGSVTDNMIAPVPLAPSTGFAYNYVNLGSISNRGIELALRGAPVSTRYGLRWELFAMYNKNVNNVVSLNNGVDHVSVGGFNGMDIVAAVGHPYGTYYAADIEYWKDDKGKWHPVVDQTTGLPVPTKNPVYRGSFQPKFQASWGTDVTYKGIKFHALFVTKQGGEFYSQTKMQMDMNGTSPETIVNNRNPYVWANSYYNVANTNIYLPNSTKFSPYNYYTTEAQMLPAQGLVNASYVKLQEMALSYKIPQKYYRHSPFGSLEAGVFGNNLILWTAKSNHYEDPEETSAGAMGNGQGFNYLARPSLRNYGAFIKVIF